MVGRPFVLLDHEAGHAATAQIGGERKPDGAAADDQDRGLDRIQGIRHSGSFLARLRRAGAPQI
jgi:hypothetical protein